MTILFVWAVVAAAGPGTQSSWDWVMKAEFNHTKTCEAAAKNLQFKNYRCIAK